MRRIVLAASLILMSLGACAQSTNPVERCVGKSMGGGGSMGPAVLLILPIYLPIAFGVCSMIHSGPSSAPDPS
jgi:hypothetical protein